MDLFSSQTPTSVFIMNTPQRRKSPTRLNMRSVLCSVISRLMELISLKCRAVTLMEALWPMLFRGVAFAPTKLPLLQ
jgi:hypothetical protein